MKYIISILLAVFFFGNPVFAKDYYVSVNNGNDSNAGTIDSPLKTIQAAATKMLAGDICYIRGGVYRESVQPKNSGTDGAPIVFQNYNNEKVTITATKVVTGFTQHDNSIYVANIDATVSQVFVDGALMNLASHPNFSISDMNWDKWADVNFATDKTATVAGLEAFSGIEGAHIIGLCGLHWITNYGEIASQTGNKVTAINTSYHWKNFEANVYLGKGKGYVLGSLSLLDSPTEWHHQDNKLYIWAQGNQNPNNIVVEARVDTVGMNLNSLSYIVVKGLHFKAANVTLRNSTKCIVEDCSIRYPTPFAPFKNGFNRDTKDPETWEGNGVEISGQDNIIRNSYIAHCWGDGLSVWGTNNTVENCLVEDCDWLCIDSAPLSVTGTGHVIKQNTFRNAARSILVHRYLGAGKILNNNLSAAGIICEDLGLTYTFQTNGAGTEIAYNKVFDNYAEENGPGIYLDNTTQGFNIHHNVVWNCETGIRTNLSSQNNQVFNNTLYGNNRAMGAWGLTGTKFKNVKTWNNISDVGPFEGDSAKNNFIIEKNVFVDADAYDFTLAAGASVIDKGLVIPGITDGFIGAAPDAGAYEFGATTWTSGATITIPDFDDDVPSSPYELIATAMESGTIRLDWKNPSTSHLGFIVERKEGHDSFAEIANISQVVESFTDTSIETALVLYTYRIRLFNAYGNSSYSNYVEINAVSAGQTLGLQAEECDANRGINIVGSYIGSCDNGDWIRFDNVNFNLSYNSCKVRYAVESPYGGQTVEFRLDSLNGTIIGAFSPEVTGGWTIFKEQSFKITPTEGTHTLFIVFKGTQGIGNFDWFQFQNSNGSSIGIIEINKHINTHLTIIPNPCISYFTLSYKPEMPGQARVEMLNTTGQIVAVLYNGYHELETITLTWENSQKLKSGMYFIHLIDIQKNQIRSDVKKLICQTE